MRTAMDIESVAFLPGMKKTNFLYFSFFIVKTVDS